MKKWHYNENDVITGDIITRVHCIKEIWPCTCFFCHVGSTFCELAKDFKKKKKKVPGHIFHHWATKINHYSKQNDHVIDIVVNKSHDIKEGLTSLSITVFIQRGPKKLFYFCYQFFLLFTTSATLFQFKKKSVRYC